MKYALYGVEIALSLALIVMLLLQLRGGGVSGIFGGWGSGSSSYRSRRGIEKVLFRLTIISAVLFVVVAALSLLLVD